MIRTRRHITRDGEIYIPVSVTAGFFGQKAEWNSENGSVKIGDKLIYPDDGCEIKASRTMAKAEKAAELLGVKLLYSDENTAILGKKELSKSELDSVVSALSGCCLCYRATHRKTVTGRLKIPTAA